jgi:hypothetical protein
MSVMVVKICKSNPVGPHQRDQLQHLRSSRRYVLVVVVLAEIVELGA